MTARFRRRGVSGGSARCFGPDATGDADRNRTENATLTGSHNAAE